MSDGIDIEGLEALERKATPGPWAFSPWHIEEGSPAVRYADGHGWIIANTSSDDNAEFIAALRNAAPALIEAAKERDSWRKRESETQEALQAIGEEFGVLGGEPRTDGVRRILTEQRARLAEIESGDAASFQPRVNEWILACFGPEIAKDKIERNHRFLEEALELVQANGATASEAHHLVEYVFSRPTGDPAQEVGGVMNTLAALCTAIGADLNAAAETELARVWTKVEVIRAKQAAKPKHSPLPQAWPESGDADLRAEIARLGKAMEERG